MADPRAPRPMRGGPRPPAGNNADNPCAAVPAYVGSSFLSAPPGHRFRLYFRGWNDRWQLLRTRKKEMVRAAAEPGDYRHIFEPLHQRQLGLAEAVPGQVLVLKATTIAPFVTGVGAEHPLENGFAFFDPYGVPYLPGSSVKGVVRRAAEELALFDPGSGWDLLALWWLFGFDATSAFVSSRDRIPEGLLAIRGTWQSAFRQACGRLSVDSLREWLEAAADPALKGKWSGDPVAFLHSLAGEHARAAEHARGLHQSGSLRFWDVLVRPPEQVRGALRVDIMNPHHHKYYQDGEAPGDFRSPNPIFFLSVPPGAALTFIVELAPVAALPKSLRESWRSLVAGALRHACTWLGFGAKTAVGYGALRLEEAPQGPPPQPGAGEPVGTPGESGAGGRPRPALEAFLMEFNALAPARLPGAVDAFVQRALNLPPEDQPAAARAIVERIGRKEARKKAKDRPHWKRILELAGEG